MLKSLLQLLSLSALLSAADVAITMPDTITVNDSVAVTLDVNTRILLLSPTAPKRVILNLDDHAFWSQAKEKVSSIMVPAGATTCTLPLTVYATDPASERTLAGRITMYNAMNNQLIGSSPFSKTLTILPASGVCGIEALEAATGK